MYQVSTDVIKNSNQALEKFSGALRLSFFAKFKLSQVRLSWFSTTCSHKDIVRFSVLKVKFDS